MSATAIALIVVRVVLWIVLLIMSIVLPGTMVQTVSAFLQEDFFERLVREDEEDEETVMREEYSRLVRCSGNAMAVFVIWTVALVLVLKI